jgi:hypothetical protein
VQRQRELFEIVLARQAGGRLTDAPSRREQKADRDDNDADDDKNFDQAQSVSWRPGHG